MFVKTVKITNPKNTVLQIPAIIMSKWGLTDKDSIIMSIDATTGYITLAPQKGHFGS